MYSVLVKVPFQIEKYVHSVAVGSSSLYMWIIPSWLCVVELNYDLTDCGLSAGSAYFWERGSISFTSYIFLGTYTLMTVNVLLEYWSLCHNIMLLSILIKFLALSSAPSEINTATPFFSLACCIFLCHISFYYCVLYLKWASCRQHIVGSCFWTHSDNLIFQLV